MRVSLVQPHRPTALHLGLPLVSESGAHVLLGGGRDDLVAPVRPAANSLFGPRGVAASGPEGPLFVSDTGHQRVLGWRRIPRADFTPADFVLGQADFSGEARHGGHGGLNVPTGIAIGAGVLAVADAWNHRVLLWHGLPTISNQLPDLVLGQSDFTGSLANRGAPIPDANTLNWCYGVAIYGERLIVADTGNRRVLVWDKLPETHGAPADMVLGQNDFTTRDEAGATGMRWPHAACMAQGRLFIADAGTSRVLAWNRLPRHHNAPCDAVLGQATAMGGDHNRGAYDPGAATLSMPYGLAATPQWLLLADTANSRLLGFDLAKIDTGMPADALAGQRGFHDKGENRWQPAARDSLCWPYGIAVCGNTAIVADSGNNRVLLWRLE